MPTDLRARVPIDDRVVEAISELRKERGHIGTVEFLRGRGHHFITESVLYNIKDRRQQTVSWEFYLDLVGKERAEEIPWEVLVLREPSYLARKIAYWHCYFFDAKKHEFAEEVAREARIHEVEYAPHTIDGILFSEKGIKRIHPTITDIVTRMFNTANGSSYSLDQIQDLVNYFDSIHTGERNPNTVSWNVVEPIVDRLIILTGKSFRALMGGVSRVVYRRNGTGGRKATVEQYSALLGQLKAQPRYAAMQELLQVLNQGVNILRGTGSDTITAEYVPSILGLAAEEVQLVREGIQNYGKAFMKYVFPAYIAIRDKHGFPANFFEWVVNFPRMERMGEGYKPPHAISQVPLDAVGKIVGDHLRYHKKILDTNRRRNHNIGVTESGIIQRLREAGEEIKNHASLYNHR